MPHTIDQYIKPKIKDSFEDYLKDQSQFEEIGDRYKEKGTKPGGWWRRKEVSDKITKRTPHLAKTGIGYGAPGSENHYLESGLADAIENLEFQEPLTIHEEINKLRELFEKHFREKPYTEKLWNNEINPILANYNLSTLITTSTEFNAIKDRVGSILKGKITEYEELPEISTEMLASCECLKEVYAGALYSLFLGENNSPKIRLFPNPHEAGMYWVTSKEILGFQGVDDVGIPPPEKINNIAWQLVVSRMLGNTDLKDENYGIVKHADSDQYDFYVIDYDCCFTLRDYYYDLLRPMDLSIESLSSRTGISKKFLNNDDINAAILHIASIVKEEDLNRICDIFERKFDEIRSAYRAGDHIYGKTPNKIANVVIQRFHQIKQLALKQFIQADNFSEFTKNLEVIQPNKEDKSYLLAEAIKEGKVKFVDKLLEINADPHSKLEDGRSALDIAKEKGQADIYKSLEDHGVSLDPTSQTQKEMKEKYQELLEKEEAEPKVTPEKTGPQKG